MILVLCMDSLQCLGGEAAPEQAAHGLGLLITDGLGWQLLGGKMTRPVKQDSRDLFSLGIRKRFCTTDSKELLSLVLCCSWCCQSAAIASLRFPEFGFDMLS